MPVLLVDVPYPDTVDDLAEALRSDPVIVHQMMGSGDAEGADRRLTKLVEELPFPAYVALVRPPADMAGDVADSRYLATALSRRINEPGLYVVEMPETVFAVRLVAEGRDPTIYSLQNSRNKDEVARGLDGGASLPPQVEAEIALRTAAEPEQEDYKVPNLDDAVVDDLADRAEALQPFTLTGDRDTSDPPEPWTIGKRFMVGTTVALGVALLIFQSVVGWPGWRRRRDQPKPATAFPATPRPDEVRAEASAALTHLAQRLPAAPAGDRARMAMLARQAAEPLLESDDTGDLVGALVLARVGDRELDRATNPARAAYRPCFFNPLHGPGELSGSWRYGEADITVPVCRACAADLRKDRGPHTLHLGRRPRPYYAQDDVWARTGYGALADDLPQQVLADRARGSRR